VPIPPSIDYGQVAATYDNSRCIEPAIHIALIDGLRALGARSVLEIGAGIGNYTLPLTASGLSVIALDRSPEMVEIGAHKTYAAWILADAHALPFRARSLDAILGVNVLHHISALPGALAEFRRVPRLGMVLQAVVRESRDALVSPLFSRNRCRVAAASSDVRKCNHIDFSRRLFASRNGEDPLFGTGRSYLRSGALATSSLVRFEFPQIDLRISTAGKCGRCARTDRARTRSRFGRICRELRRRSRLPMPTPPTA
jgi:SAM-dependent methyltransferase